MEDEKGLVEENIQEKLLGPGVNLIKTLQV